MHLVGGGDNLYFDIDTETGQALAERNGRVEVVDIKDPERLRAWIDKNASPPDFTPSWPPPHP